MSSSVALLAELAPEEAERTHSDRLKTWSEPGRTLLNRAGTLRGLAQIGTVIWAAGLAWAAQRGLEVQRSHTVPVSVLPGAALIAAGITVRSVLLAAGDRAAARGAGEVRRQLQGRLLDATLPVRGGLDHAVPDAALAEALDSEVSRLEDWLTGYLPARRSMMIGSGLVLVAVAAQSWLVVLLLVAATPLLPGNLKVIGLGTRAAVHAQLAAVRLHSTRLLDQLRGLPTLVGLGAQERAAAVLHEDDSELARRTATVLRIAFLATAWIELLITGTLAVVATYCGLVLLDYLHVPGVPGHMSLGTALFVLVLTPAYFAPARELARGYHARAEASAAAELIGQVLDGASVDAAVPDVAQVWDAASGAVGVRLAAVTVRFAEENRPALRDVSVSVGPGRVLAVTGLSGAGKSTLLAVAAGLLEPESGCCVHSDDAGDHEPLPSRVAWVAQPAHLVPGTLRDNLLLARRDASDDQLAAAFGRLGFQDLLASLPAGLDTALGERGTGVSSGQSQQLALVRALLRDAPLLILDEPTAHLDPAAEARMIMAIRTLVRDRTVLLATHSPALLPLADDVVVLDEGRLR